MSSSRAIEGSKAFMNIWVWGCKTSMLQGKWTHFPWLINRNSGEHNFNTIGQNKFGGDRDGERWLDYVANRKGIKA